MCKYRLRYVILGPTKSRNGNWEMGNGKRETWRHHFGAQLPPLGPWIIHGPRSLLNVKNWRALYWTLVTCNCLWWKWIEIIALSLVLTGCNQKPAVGLHIGHSHRLQWLPPQRPYTVASIQLQQQFWSRWLTSIGRLRLAHWRRCWKAHRALVRFKIPSVVAQLYCIWVKFHTHDRCIQMC